MQILYPVAKVCVLATVFAATSLADSSATTATAVPAEASKPEPMWGRLYVRRGFAPIQYFRDRYGGPMSDRELYLHFPVDRLGCTSVEQVPAVDAARVNASVALVVDRGVCSFETKSRIAEALGAGALIVVSEDESVSAPVALVGKGEIQIPTVMIRKSAGDMLRLVAENMDLHGKLIPITCTKNPYVCAPRTEEESEYIDEWQVRSGVIVADDSTTPLGGFLTATYGSVLPQMPLQPVESTLNGCGSLDAELVGGKVAIFDGRACPSLVQVSNAQRAGVAFVLLEVGDSADSMKRPSVQENWQAYNITIGAAAISSSTASKIKELTRAGRMIKLEPRNSIADAWDEIRRLSARTAWPTRRDRKFKEVKRVLHAFKLDIAQTEELKHNFLAIAGGSRDEWDSLLPSIAPEDENSSPMAVDRGQASTVQEVTVSAEGM